MAYFFLKEIMTNSSSLLEFRWEKIYEMFLAFTSLRLPEYLKPAKSDSIRVQGLACWLLVH